MRNPNVGIGLRNADQEGVFPVQPRSKTRSGRPEKAPNYRSSMKPSKEIQEAANRVAKHLDADVIFINSPLERPLESELTAACSGTQLRRNVLLILVTLGGSPQVAYRIARHLQTKYERFRLFVTGLCKSAGTLVALGAHELVVADRGELGPLDVQMQKKDELWERRSGLIHLLTLSVLQDNAAETFEELFLRIKGRLGGAITLRTAAEIATQITTGLFTPLYEQIDPLRITEARRSMTIAAEYGRRLLEEGKNSDHNRLNRIIATYPSHGYVIDRREATELFTLVLEPNADESILARELGPAAYWPAARGDMPAVIFLSSAGNTPAQADKLGGSNE